MPARKCCFVPKCTNTSSRTPSKIFVTVPKIPKRRERWFAAARRDVEEVSPTSAMYCCEDHFDLEKDMENYMEYKLSNVKARMNPDVIPHKFTCQPNRIVLPTKVTQLSERRTRKEEISDYLHQSEAPSTLKHEQDELSGPSTSSIIRQKCEKTPQMFDQLLSCEKCCNENYDLKVFKDRCHKLETLISSYGGRNMDKPVSVKDILQYQQDSKYLLDPDTHACVMCLELIIMEDCEKLGSELPCFPLFVRVLSKTTWKSILDPVICRNCSSSLNRIYHFHEPCWHCRQNLKTYSRDDGSLDYKDSNVAQMEMIFIKGEPCEEPNKYENSQQDGRLGVTLMEENELDKILKQEIKEECIDLDDLEGDSCDGLPEMDISTNIDKNLVEPENGLTPMKRSKIELHKCPKCEFGTKSNKTLARHLRVEHDKGIHECEQCDFKTKWREYLKMHVKLKHDQTGESYSCDQCDYETKFKVHLTVHVEYIHSRNCILHDCPQCCYQAKCKSQLKKHIKNLHTTVATTLRCTQCTFETKWKNVLRKHLAGEHSNAAAQHCCPHCGFLVKTKSHLKEHIKNKHDNDSTVLQCDACDFTTRVRKRFTQHVKYYHDDNCTVYRCSDCDYSAKSQGHLKQHVTVKHGNIFYECSQCDYKTKIQRLLQEHLIIRHDKYDEMFQCERCSYKAKLQKRLSQHVKSAHGTVTIYKCTHCKYQTKNSRVLKQHYALKHDQDSVQYECSFCVFSTKMKEAFYQHVTDIHNGIGIGRVAETEELTCQL